MEMHETIRLYPFLQINSNLYQIHSQIQKKIFENTAFFFIISEHLNDAPL